MYKFDLQVRPSDYDAFGHINNAVYFSLMQQTFAKVLIQLSFEKDWRSNSDYYWKLKSLAIEYRRPVVSTDLVTTSLWFEKIDQTDLVTGWEVLSSDVQVDSIRPTTCARATWNRIHRQTRSTSLLPENLLKQPTRCEGSAPKSFNQPTAPSQLATYFWDHRVMTSDVDLNGNARLQAICNWLQESLVDASAQAGWPNERRLAAGFLTLVTRHNAEFISSPQAGDQIRISSRAVEVRRLRGTWIHEMHKLTSGELLMRDYSTGVFLDLTGRPTSPPSEMMKNIQFGQK